ncbi:hypothetical protein H4R99_008604, partial [Coemansia sp. RSA 1722]
PTRAVVPGMATVAPRPLLVEHPVFVAAMGLVNPFAIELAVAIKTFVDSAPVVPAFIGPVKPSAAQLGISAVESHAPQIVIPAADYSAHMSMVKEDSAALGQKTARSTATSTVEYNSPAPEPAPAPMSTRVSESEPAHDPAFYCTCEPATETREQASEKFTLG